MEKGKILIPKLIQVGEELANTINLTRHYMDQSTTTSSDTDSSTDITTTTTTTTSITTKMIEKIKSRITFSFDPRYLVFEFVWNLQLRKKQIEIVNDFRTNLALGKYDIYIVIQYVLVLNLRILL